MSILDSLNKALGPLFEFTDALSGEKYVSVSFLKPVLHLFNDQILSPKEGETELTKAVKGGVLKYLNEKYDDAATNNILDMATLVDPQVQDNLHEGKPCGVHEEPSCHRAAGYGEGSHGATSK